jgi:hypothetical protein
MSILGNGKSSQKAGFTGGPPKPPDTADAGSGDESPEGGNKVIRIADPVVVRDLANALAQRPFRIIADLMEFGQFRNVTSMVGFETAARIASKYGYKAEKIG